MTSVYAAIAVILVGAVLALTLRSYRPEFAILISIAVSVMALVFVLPYFSGIIDFLQTTARSIQGADDKIRLLLKALGVAICAELAADLCRDGGESAMAGKIELCGKAAVLVISLPLATELLRMIEGLLR